MEYNIVHPGNVISKNDGDIHFIGFTQLVKLYRLDPSKCIDASKKGVKYPKNSKHYYPDPTGAYNR